MKDNTIEKFNEDVLNMLFIIMDNAPKKINNIQYFYLDYKPGKAEIKKYDDINLMKKEQKNLYLGYYWVEFIYNNEKYKLAMFYKDFDESSGNIHILPGMIQIWKKADNDINNLKEIIVTENIVSKKYTRKKSFNRNSYKCNGGVPYNEQKWSPIVKVKSSIIKMVCDMKNAEIISKEVWNNFPNNIIKNNGIIGCLEGKDAEKIYTEELRKGIYEEKKLKIGHGTYKLYKWIIDEIKMRMDVYYKMIYIDGGYYCIFDGIKRTLSLKNNIKGPNYIDKNTKMWKINYKYEK